MLSLNSAEQSCIFNTRSCNVLKTMALFFSNSMRTNKNKASSEPSDNPITIVVCFMRPSKHCNCIFEPTVRPPVCNRITMHDVP